MPLCCAAPLRWPLSERPHLPLLLLAVQTVLLVLFTLLVHYPPLDERWRPRYRDTLASWALHRPEETGQRTAGNQRGQLPTSGELPVEQSDCQMCLCRVVFVILFGVFAEYSVTKPNAAAQDTPPGKLLRMYSMFQDVHVMIFIGFGFLMTFLKRYGLSAVSLNFLLAALVLQWAVIVNGFFHLHDGRIRIDVERVPLPDLENGWADCAQIWYIARDQLVGCRAKVPIFAFNEVIGRRYLQVSDMGDSIFVHAFGAYFGLAVSFAMFRKDRDSENAASNTVSDLFSMIGTIFLWCFWPSFNSALAQGDVQSRAVINTYLSLCASCVVSFAVSALLDKRSKFSMEHIQNATLAGGVAVGTAADMMVQPFGAVIIGSVAGVLSVVGFSIITPALDERCRVHDTCGVHNLHGMPGVLAGIVGAIMAAMATHEQYADSLYVIFPAMEPMENATAQALAGPEHGTQEGRSAGYQGGMQILALLITLAIAIVTGLVTGAILRLRVWEQLDTADLYSDRRFFVVHDPEEGDAPPPPAGNESKTSEQL
ncbi:Ammonium transporter Rh type B-B [Amphibalanus amphitrite]|uniref:Ammonium transporter Rh type B-B n=1 Tax=Amphibalanus amphitrite TaxID=1232801 RepID=A0A6A4V565_AMPAM|nr:Ammonium transporter Rh type B-B [Amphibalanus amphitrite]KAF0291417.1 Ammonium transporter Rh type B-B [Amphibalanus amphitrite]